MFFFSFCSANNDSFLTFLTSQKIRKSKAPIDETSKDLVVARKNGAYIVAPVSIVLHLTYFSLLKINIFRNILHIYR